MNKPVDPYTTADKTALTQQDSAPTSSVERAERMVGAEREARSLRSLEMDRVGGGSAFYIIGGVIASTVIWMRWGGDINAALNTLGAWISG